MARYWWQCISCGDRPAWLAVCESRSVAAFIRDELAPSGWDQRLLRRTCKCGRRSLYITYRLQRGDPERVSVKHVVGLLLDDDYLPMVWETFRHGTPRTKWVDFKYQRGRSPWGLTKRLVLKKRRPMEPTRSIDSDLLDNADRFGDPFFRRFTLRHAPRPLRLDERVEKNYLFPTFYADVTCSIGIFLCDYAAAATLMPDRRMKPVRMTRGRALVTLASYVYRNVMGVPPYNEIAMTIPVMVDSWFRPPVLPMILDVFSGFGFYVFGMPVTSLENKIRGNRIWGLPKTLNRIDISDEGDECETAAFEDDGVTPLLTLRTPTTGTPTEFDVGSNIYSVLDGRLHRARTCFRGTFNVTKHMGQLVKKGTLPDTHALEIGDGPGAHALRSLHIERQAFQFRFARSMNACFDLPDPGFG